MLLVLLLLVLLALILFGVGFTLHWLFILAVIALLVALVLWLVGRSGSRW
jgi:hypothetical protein